MTARGTEARTDMIHTDVLTKLVGDRGSDRTSLFLPTEPSRSACYDNRVRFAALLQQAQRALRAGGMTTEHVATVLEGAREFYEDVALWERPREGIALFTSPGGAWCYWVPRAVPELVTVGDRFTITPLLPMSQLAGSFFVLALSHDDIQLFEGDHVRLDRVVLDESPLAPLATMPRRPAVDFRTERGRRAGRTAVLHGRDGGEDLVLDHFRGVDDALRDVVRDERTPVVLAGAGRLQELYREVNSHPGLLASGLAGGPRDWSHGLLHRRAHEIVAAVRWDHGSHECVDDGAVQETGGTISDPREVYRAADQGRIATMFLSARTARWENVVPESRTVRLGNPPSPTEYPSLAAAATLRHGGSVRVVPAARMPGDTPVAAIVRF